MKTNRIMLIFCVVCVTATVMLVSGCAWGRGGKCRAANARGCKMTSSATGCPACAKCKGVCPKCAAKKGACPMAQAKQAS